jgi:two-component response regulator (ARR-B family)
MLCSQKYRLSLKREQDATQKTMIRDHHPSLTLNLQGGFSQFTNPQFFMAISQSEHRNNIQNNLCSPVSMHSLFSAHSLTRVNTNYDGMLIPSFGQQSKQLDRTYPNCSHTGIGTTNDGNFASLGQKGNHNVEEHLNQGTTFSNVGTHGPTFLGNSQQQLQFPLLQPQPLPEKEDESDIPNIVTEARNELLVMKNEFLDYPNNDLW